MRSFCVNNDKWASSKIFISKNKYQQSEQSLTLPMLHSVLLACLAVGFEPHEEVAEHATGVDGHQQPSKKVCTRTRREYTNAFYWRIHSLGSTGAERTYNDELLHAPSTLEEVTVLITHNYGAQNYQIYWLV